MTMALTGNGEILGTLPYMSPEQLQGHEAGPPSDLFSFGLVLYEMLTGKRAFDAASPASMIAAILERDAPSLAGVAPAASHVASPSGFASTSPTPRDTGLPARIEHDSLDLLVFGRVAPADRRQNTTVCPTSSPLHRLQPCENRNWHFIHLHTVEPSPAFWRSIRMANA